MWHFTQFSSQFSCSILLQFGSTSLNLEGEHPFKIVLSLNTETAFSYNYKNVVDMFRCSYICLVH